jgi:hypothetical protein
MTIYIAHRDCLSFFFFGVGGGGHLKISTVESEGRQMKQCRIKYFKNSNKFRLKERNSAKPRGLHFESYIVNKLPERGSMYRRDIEMIEKSCNMLEMLSNKFPTEVCSNGKVDMSTIEYRQLPLWEECFFQ